MNVGIEKRKKSSFYDSKELNGFNAFDVCAPSDPNNLQNLPQCLMTLNFLADAKDSFEKGRIDVFLSQSPSKRRLLSGEDI